MLHGIHAWDYGLSAAKIWPAFKDLQRTLWRSVYKPNWGHPPTDRTVFSHLRIARQAYKMQTILDLQTTQMPTSASQVMAWAKTFLGAAEGAFDFVEILNESNYNQYWPHDLALAIKQVQTPLFNVFNDAGIKVIGMPLAWTDDKQTFDVLIRNLYFHHSHIAGAHVYGTTADGHNSMADTFRRLVKENSDHEVAFTEWGFHGAGHMTDNQWAQAIKKSYANDIRSASDMADTHSICYFQLFEGTSMAGHEGLVDPYTLKPHQPFYDAVKACTLLP